MHNVDKGQTTGQAAIAESLDAIDPTAETNAFLTIVAALRGVPRGSHARLLDAAITLLGSSPQSRSESRPQVQQPLEQAVDGLPRRASIWLGQSGLNEADLDSVFHRALGSVEIITHTVAGTSNKERARGCYLLAGIRGLLTTGEPRFSDDEARAICRDLGCYDKANHSTYVKSLGNLVMGSKSSAYELTQPGLRAAAELMREMRTN